MATKHGKVVIYYKNFNSLTLTSLGFFDIK